MNIAFTVVNAMTEIDIISQRICDITENDLIPAIIKKENSLFQILCLMVSEKMSLVDNLKWEIQLARLMKMSNKAAQIVEDYFNGSRDEAIARARLEAQNKRLMSELSKAKNDLK